MFPYYALQFGGEDFFVYPEHYCDAEAGFYEWNCDDQPLSSGPYILEEWVADDHLTFVRNPNYFEEGKPSIDEVIVQIVPEETVKQAMMLEGMPIFTIGLLNLLQMSIRRLIMASSG